MALGRNTLCPCGSGLKYKRCCGQAVTQPASDVARANAVKELDRQLVEPLTRFALRRFGPKWISTALAAYPGSDAAMDPAEMQLAVAFSLFHYPADAADPLALVFADVKGAGLLPKLYAVLAAQLESWLGVWEVQRVQPGVGMAVKDLLSGEERFVHEVAGSQGITERATVLGRVVDSDGISFFGGVHPQPLPPFDADIVVRQVRRACRVRTRPVRIAMLRDAAIQQLTIGLWRDLVEKIRQRPMPTITNTDGDPLALTTDYFDILTADRAALIARVATLQGAEEQETRENGEISIVITKPGNAKNQVWANTVIGTVVIVGARMRAESNSVRRADRLRRALELHLGVLVRHRLRDESGAMELFAQARRPAASRKIGRTPEKSPDLKELEREIKERYMVAWLDEAIPALRGLTPREASKASARTRRELDLLLRHIENAESRLPPDERYDVGILRTELGMPE